MRTQKITPLIFLIIVALALAGCNLPGQPAATPNSQPGGTETPDASTPEFPVVPEAQLIRVAMFDRLQGWGLNGSQVLRTQDGGQTWLNITPLDYEESEFTPTHEFLDVNTAWVMQAVQTPEGEMQGRLYHTQDGGRQWSSLAVDFYASQLAFADTMNGFALVGLGAAAGSSAAAIYKTDDGGLSWTLVHQINPELGSGPGLLPFSGMKDGIAALDGQRSWVSGSVPMPGAIWLFQSVDGGSTWNQQPISAPAGFEGAMFAAGEPRFFNATQGKLPVQFVTEASWTVLYRTEDAGATWTPSNPVQSGGSYTMASIQDAWVWDGERIAVTRDGGATWAMAETNINLAGWLMQIDFVDQYVGWATAASADGSYQLYQTLDSGVTWTQLQP